ncbi:uncharacterized protein LOC134814359 [Bolinopsis microptera]|uniref:uncharacterized protein LOC134814359 n=1 Tax=Bolinopsis microptera TaxID=2820187 RepID=UPI00307ABCEA
MNLVPSHLKNTHDFLRRIRNITPNDLKSFTLFTADVKALCTNINVLTAIEDVMEFAKENRQSINTYGLHLSDLQELLETTLGKSYFVYKYNNQVYLQLLGLFMGTNPCNYSSYCQDVKTGITFRLRKPEDNTAHCTYSRFYDDLNGATTNKRKAQQLCNLIEQQDPDKLIKLTVDYSDNQNDFVPFLNTEIKIDSDGIVHSRLYRKPQKKPIILHYNSHHTTRTKNATVESMYSL